MYIKLDDEGNELSEDAENWSMVRDANTGYVWEVKTSANKHILYAWEEAFVFVSQLNERKFGGYNDWRLPAVRELYTLVDVSKYDPAINIVYFPNTQLGGYWSSTTEDRSTGRALYVGFLNGYVYGNGKSYLYYVRAVRGGHRDFIVMRYR